MFSERSSIPVYVNNYGKDDHSLPGAGRRVHQVCLQDKGREMLLMRYLCIRLQEASCLLNHHSDGWGGLILGVILID